MKKRKTESKKRLQEALTQLLFEKDFENITISDLCQKAGINRGTFYLHYKDKNDMIDQLKNQSLDKLFHLLDSPSIYTDTKQLLIETLTLLKENFQFIEAVSQSSSLQFTQTIKDFIYRVLVTVENHDHIVRQQYGGIPYEYALEVYLSSIENIISYWIKSGGKESPEALTTIILKAVTLDQN
ncbi:TetR/AcrR family transcriptional regulator [Streptococcus uberis]|uniref:TetR/AcrR family transcriptional regulator n=1 Tax=Streptococcus uberis TaxID=1349 RepID=UPI0006204C4D|nr:TetR/AcrR family transcriptional regulator [Streptococcus uberis]KKF44040.1 TetR family transcriptional regulator [Streptococcus uberis EF20/0145]